MMSRPTWAERSRRLMRRPSTTTAAASLAPMPTPSASHPSASSRIPATTSHPTISVSAGPMSSRFRIDASLRGVAAPLQRHAQQCDDSAALPFALHPTRRRNVAGPIQAPPLSRLPTSKPPLSPSPPPPRAQRWQCHKNSNYYPDLALYGSQHVDLGIARVVKKARDREEEISHS